jgi:putative nucleotidyltransferase with HDIG domain
VLSAAFFMLLTAFLVIGFLPLLETGFKIMTNATLMEYVDPNNDLLRRLTIEAPGTYQHSVVVGNLAEAAALAIGANGLFCRVATLYHDVGKMATSQYFTENQLGEVNIHQLLTPQESAQVIMAHVAEGVALAREAGLPEPIIDIIKEHHGTTLVYYFYRKQLELVGGDKSQINEREFRYSGPKPRSKESGIIMIADSFEAASRSLDKVNEETLMELIDRIVNEKVGDGQFDQCLLTFEELSIIKRTLVKTLLAAGHSRIKYPVWDKNESHYHTREMDE